MNDMALPARALSTLRVSIVDAMFLNARTKGLTSAGPPEALYQAMAQRRMALMATLPVGSFAVSIPGAGDSGFPILKTASSFPDGFEIVYTRRSNGRYEAAHVRYRENLHVVADFIPTAKHWTEEHYGGLKAIPGRYAYFVPSIDAWGVVQRDSGYTAWDTSAMPSVVTPELESRRRMPRSSGILARIPVYKSSKRLSEEVQSVFTQVQVALGPDSDPRRGWIEYEEYRRARAERARVPDAIIPDFQDWLRQIAEECKFEYWIFHPGMLFGEHVEWWGNRCRRRTEHEGIDFFEGFRLGAGACRIPDGASVPSIANGEVVAVLDDFIGKTVVVRHGSIARPNGDIFHTFLSHILPSIGTTQPVRKGQMVGRVGKSTRTTAPIHLHVTGAWIPQSIAANEIGLELIHPAYAPVSLADFRPVLPGNPLCRLETLLSPIDRA